MGNQTSEINIRRDTQEIVIKNTPGRLEYMTPQEIATILENIANVLCSLPEIPLAEMTPEDREQLGDNLL